ncbi:HAD family hydrolase [Fodinibius sp.]|uniref:HAD family hydrolase n=1 Tax=Fodinibius sp. TaxID=1872440 RepID=UPI003564F032
MNNNTFVVSDLDGTLLNNDGLLSKHSRTKLQRLINNGLNFTVASARSLHTISYILQDLQLSLPVICLNGAYISDYNTKKHLVINEIQQEVRQGIRGYVEKHNVGVFISTHHNGEDFLFYNQINNGGLQWYYEDRIASNDQRLKKTISIKELRDHYITCFTFIDKEKKLLQIKRELLDQFQDKVEIHLFENLYSRGWYWLTAHDYRATKDRAIQQLQDEFGHQDKELIVFGDHINDIKMFKIAHQCIAVQNADERLKKHAHEVIGTNMEDSVANYLEAMFRPQ